MPLKVEHPNRNRLIVSKSKLRNAWRAAYALLFFTAWYWVLVWYFLHSPDTWGSTRSPYFVMWLICMVFPILMAGTIKKHAMAAFRPVRFQFDRSTNTVSMNEKPIAHFSEIESVKVQGLDDSYRLYLELIGGRFIEIETSSDELTMRRVARILARHIRREYVSK